MTQFSSKTPFNDDPEPWRSTLGKGRFSRNVGYCKRAPRPEFDRPQHNPGNRILMAFREREDIRNIYARRQWRNFLREGWDQSICNATPEEERHAGKVFERWDEIARNHAIDDLLNLEDDD